MIRRIKERPMKKILASYVGMLKHGNNHETTQKLIGDFQKQIHLE